MNTVTIAGLLLFCRTTIFFLLLHRMTDCERAVTKPQKANPIHASSIELHPVHFPLPLPPPPTPVQFMHHGLSQLPTCLTMPELKMYPRHRLSSGGGSAIKDEVKLFISGLTRWRRTH